MTAWDDGLISIEAEAREPFYANVDEFVCGYLLPNWRLPCGSGGITWCARWWEHAEAITRLEALWESWERSRIVEGVGMAVWWRDYADPHMAILTDAQSGPFTKCRADLDRHELLPLWQAVPAPHGLFRDAALE
ncbi:DUF4913 domain-containing protein [Terrabacter carboxydivorans]|uniref:DUF4913 domain-containing protein n=1 Tax=Terrabacter carboxydivorans TaxID=619730 RepID=A0ABP5ZTG2_9MICO